MSDKEFIFFEGAASEGVALLETQRRETTPWEIP